MAYNRETSNVFSLRARPRRRAADVSRVSRKEDEFFDMFKEYSLLIVEAGRLYAEYVHGATPRTPRTQMDKVRIAETNGGPHGSAGSSRRFELLVSSTDPIREGHHELAKSMD